MKESRQHWILWDGDCGFCQHSVQWLKVRDKNNLLYPMPYQAAPSPPMTPEIYVACANAVHIVTADGQVLKAGRATLFLMDLLGWGWLAKLLSLPPFLWAVEIAYKVVATNRLLFSRLFFPRAGAGATCAIAPHRPASEKDGVNS